MAGRGNRWRVVAAGVVIVAATAMLRQLWVQTYDLPHSAQRAETYLRERGAALNPPMLLILDYLDRRFGLPWVRPAVDSLRRQRGDCAAPATCRGERTVAAFARLIDPTARLTAEQVAALPNTLDAFTGTALYCKANGLPSAFLQDVERRLMKDDYDPPHAALALQWAIEQGCLDARAADVAALRERVLDSLVEVAGAVPEDRAIESIAMLAYAGAWTRVRPAWLQTIAGAQQESGAWGEHGAAPPNDHTTTLALWVLLEATREGRSVTWVPR